MKTLDLIFTRGDAATQCGGIILRERDGEYITHAFNRRPHTRTPTEFYWGHYFNGDDAEARARADFAERAAKAKPFEIAEGTIVAKGDEGFDITGNWEQD